MTCLSSNSIEKNSECDQNNEFDKSPDCFYPPKDLCIRSSAHGAHAFGMFCQEKLWTDLDSTEIDKK